MILYAILVTLVVGFINTLALNILEPGLALITILCISISVGLYFPLWYKRFYNSATSKIIKDVSLSREDKIKKAQKNGGTSVPLVIIFIIINSCIMTFYTNLISNILKPYNASDSTNITVTQNKQDISEDKSTQKSSNSDTSSSNKIEDAQLSSFMYFNNNYSISIGDLLNENAKSFECDKNTYEVLNFVNNYDEISITIYYNKDNFIEKYELLEKDTNKKIENIKTEAELRKLLGYYLEGTNEDELTLVKFDNSPGFGFDNDESYSYYTYTFKNKNNKEIEFKYKIIDNSSEQPIELVENKKYKLKFQVTKGSFDYEYIITDIQEI